MRRRDWFPRGHVRLGFNRRDFARTAMAVPVAAAAGAALWQRARLAPVAAALIGAGAHGREALIKQSPPAQLRYVACCDLRPSQAAKALEEFAALYGTEGAKKVRFLKDPKEVFADPTIPAVVIATPTGTHHALAKAALQAGKHVYLEAPMATSLRDARELVKLAADTGKTLAVGHQRAANPRMTEAVNYLRAGTLGEVRYIQAHWHLERLRNDPWWPNPEQLAAIRAEDGNAKLDPCFQSFDELLRWKALARTGGGMAMEALSHQLDALRLYLGEGRLPLAVTGTGSQLVPGGDLPDHLYLTVECPDHVVATFEAVASTGTMGRGEFILGTHGSAAFKDEQDLEQYKESIPSPPKDAPAKPAATAGDPKKTTVTVAAAAKSAPTMYSAASVGYSAQAAGGSKGKSSAGFTESLQRFAEAVRLRDPARVACDGRAGLAVLALTLAAAKAVREKRRIAVNPKWFDPDAADTPELA